MVTVSSFYKFTPLVAEGLLAARSDIEEAGGNLGVVGHLILSPEGYNGTVAGAPEAVSKFLTDFATKFDMTAVSFQDSKAAVPPFEELKVVVRPEIITLVTRVATAGEVVPDTIPLRNNHLSPAEWEAVLASGEDVLLIDTRNHYEWKLGTFEGAVTPPIKKFSELPAYLDNADLPKNKKTLIFCTGGVRCEKAIYSFTERGFNEVYQLDGGILRYLEEFPGRKYTGECFVFDKRVAVTQSLAPSTTYRLCPHCGDPGAIEISCSACSKNAVVCDTCLEQGSAFRSCSKACRVTL